MPAKSKGEDETKHDRATVAVVHTDMDGELQDFVKTSALNAMKTLEKGELQYVLNQPPQTLARGIPPPL